MTLSISNSKKCALITVGVVVVGLTSLCTIVPHAWIPEQDIVVSSVLPQDVLSKYFLTYANGEIDHFTQFYNLDKVTDKARRADVLFLGNSRAQYAFRQESLAPFFAQNQLNYYVMAFGHREYSPFPTAITRKYDLRPKWVVINADPFFYDKPSAHGEYVMKVGWLDSWKIRFQKVTSFWAQHYFHRIIPYFPFHPPADGWVEFRHVEDGTLYLAAHRGFPESIHRTAPEALPQITEARIRLAREFQREMRERGAELVLTAVPPSDPKFGREMARILNVPWMEPTSEELWTIDGSHLDAPSAAKFSEYFLKQFSRLLKNPEASRRDAG